MHDHEFLRIIFQKRTTHNIEAGEQTKNKQLGVPQESRILRYFVDSPLLLWFNEVSLAKCEFRQIQVRRYATWKISPADALSKRLLSLKYSDLLNYSVLESVLKVRWSSREVLMFCMSQISSLSNIELSIYIFLLITLVQVIKYKKSPFCLDSKCSQYIFLKVQQDTKPLFPKSIRTEHN